MALTPEEKAAGRTFRDAAQAELLASFNLNPPDYVVPNFIAVFRHACRSRGRSTALELHEMYESSPAFHVFTLGDTVVHVARSTDHTLPNITRQQGVDITFIPDGRFAFIYKQGRCRYCRQTARSRAGRLTLAEERPPLYPAAARS